MQLVYTPDGYPYYIPDGTDETVPTNEGRLPAVDDSAFQAAAARVRARLPTRQPDPQSLAASQGAVGFSDVGKSMFNNMVVEPAKLPGDVFSGKVDPLSDEGIARAQGLAGLAGSATLAAKPGTATLGSGMVRPMANEAIENAPTFFSNVENAVKNSKTNSATADQWLGYLKNQPGVKPEELQWTGLDNLPSGKITKAELEKHIAENKVQLKEVKLGENYSTANFDNAIDWFRPVAMEIKSLEDVALARQHNPNFRESFKDWSDKDLWNKIQKYKEIPYEEFAGKTKYHSYQLPGGENYKELLLTLPNEKSNAIHSRMTAIEKELGAHHDVPEPRRTELRTEYKELANKTRERQDYQSSHWDEPNVLAHIRMNDRVVNGQKTLHIEEIQSDWHQAGRKQGYKGEQKSFTEQELRRYNDLNSRKRDLTNVEADEFIKLQDKANAFKDPDAGVPNAPFKKTWDELALKRVIREAAEKGYDSISWTPGEAQAARYDLSKHIDSLKWYKDGDGYRISAKKGDNIVLQKSALTPNELSNHVGKEIAEKITKNEEQHGALSGLDLKVGGEGMKAFYDKMLVDRANALGKKYGTKVETNVGEIKKTSPEEVKKLGKTLYETFDRRGGEPLFEDLSLRQQQFYYDKAREKAYLADNPVPPVHVLKITPEMKEAVLKKGQPLFSAGLPTFTPVDHDPFEKKPKLIPVDFNPFTNPNAS